MEAEGCQAQDLDSTKRYVWVSELTVTVGEI